MDKANTSDEPTTSRRVRDKGNTSLTRIVHTIVLLAALTSFQPASAEKTKSAATSTALSKKVFQAAKTSVGKEMWKGYGLPNGKLGCAAALCNVLKKAGVSSVRTPLVTAMRRQLLNSRTICSERIIRNGEGREINDKALLKDCQPGDILLAFEEPPSKLNGGTSAHCGIMGEATQVYTNNWVDGIWTEVEIHQMFDYYPYIRLLRLGEKKIGAG